MDRVDLDTIERDLKFGHNYRASLQIPALISELRERRAKDADMPTDPTKGDWPSYAGLVLMYAKQSEDGRAKDVAVKELVEAIHFLNSVRVNAPGIFGVGFKRVNKALAAVEAFVSHETPNMSAKEV
jgi:hypothetical protein